MCSFNKLSVSHSFLEKEFHFEDVDASGDCLFNSIGEILFGDENKGHEIREKVSNFYSTFDTEKEYPENSLLWNISCGIKFDDDEFDCNENYVGKHSEIMSETGVWGNMNDLFICSHLFHVNIVLFNYVTKTQVSINKIQNDSALTTIYMRFINGNHFEPMLPINRYWNKDLIGTQTSDYEVVEYNTYNKSVSRFFYIIKYHDSNNNCTEQKTEYEILIDLEKDIGDLL